MSRSGRHRAQRRGRALRRAAGTGALAAAAVLAAMWLPQSATADAPVQVGWWNILSGGGQAAPEPQTPDGGLHVAAIPNQDLAFGAVLYDNVPAGATATLEFKVENLVALPPPPNPNAPSTDPHISVQACPTTTDTWKAGNDQSTDTEPSVDCDTTHFVGDLSADGKTLTFLVDTNGQTVPNELSLAILPLQVKTIPQGVGDAPVDTTEPFSFDTDKPDTESLTVTSAPVTPRTGGAPPPPPPAPQSQPAGTSGAQEPASSSSSGGGPANMPNLGGNLPKAGTSTDGGSAPVIAPSAAPTTQSAPAAVVRPTTNSTAHNVALAMLILLGLALVAGQRPNVRAPRLLGGAGRHAATPSPALAGVVGAGANAALTPEQVQALVAATMPTRGLGRFAKPRGGTPRPLI